MKKKYVFALVILTTLLAAVLAACVNSTTPSGVNLPTLDTVEIKRVNSDYIDPDNILCLEVKEESGEPRTEEVQVTINFLNKDKMPILSFKINDDLYNSNNWNAASDWSKVAVIYRPKETSGDFEITVHSIFYRQSNVQKEIQHLSGNTKTVRIAPTFNLSVVADAAVTPKPFSTEVEVKFMQSLYEIKELLKEHDMNHADYRKESYTFMGWFTSPDGEGEKVDENGRYEYYTNLTVYAHYECLYNYDILVDEHNEEYAKILSLTDAGKKNFILLEMDEHVDGYPIRELGTGSMQGLKVQNQLRVANGVEVIGDNAFMGLTIEIKLGSKVREIGKNAFNGCTGLRNFFIPSSVRKIGDHAFQGTGWDTSTNGERVVENMEKPGSVFRHSATLFIPKELEVLGKEVFRNSTFKTVYFMQDSNLIEAGEGLFRSSKSLTTVITAATIINRQTIALAEEGSVTFLPNYAFYDCSNLTTLKLGEGLENIGDRAFASTVGFKDLKVVNIPASTLVIGSYAFQNCHLTEINFADGSMLDSIEDYAFENTKVKEVNIKSTVLNNYGLSPFYNNSELRVIIINAPVVPAFQRNNRGAAQGLGGAKYVKYLVPKVSLNQYRQNWVLEGESWWSGSVWREELRIYAKEDVFVDTTNNLRIGYEDIGGGDVVVNFIIEESGYQKKSNITIPAEFDVNGMRKTVREIGKYVANPILVTVTLPDTLTKIGDNAFEGCDKLKTVNFGANITTIGKYAFRNTDLSSFYSWEKLALIAEGAFKDCAALRTVRLINGTNMMVGVSAFENAGITTLSIGSNVQNINSAAFAFTKSLLHVYMNMLAPPTHTGMMLVGPFRGAGSETEPEGDEMNLITKIYLPDAGASRAFNDNDTYKAYSKNYKVETDREEWKKQGFVS